MSQGNAYIPVWLRDADLDPFERAIYCHIASMQQCYQSAENIAEKTKMGKSKAKYALASLVEKGFLHKKKSNGRVTSTYIALNPTQKRDYQPVATRPVGENNCPYSGQLSAPTVHTVDSYKPTVHVVTPNCPYSDPPTVHVVTPKVLTSEGTYFKEAAADALRDTEDKKDFFDKPTSQPMPMAFQVMKAFQSLVEKKWGKDAVPLPLATDSTYAARFLDADSSLDEIAAVMDAVLSRLFAKNKPPPRGLAYFEQPVAEHKAVKTRPKSNPKVQELEDSGEKIAPDVIRKIREEAKKKYAISA